VELRHFRYFVALAEEGSFLRAAERLHVSQPPLSTQIKDLEEELGVRLCTRTSKGVHLTAAGKVFYDECCAMLARVQSARLLAQRADRGELGCLSLGFVSIAGYKMLPPALKCFKNCFPNIDLQLHELTTNLQIEEIRGDRLDIGIGLGPVNDVEIVFDWLAREDLILAAPIHHPLACNGHEIDLVELADEEFIVVPRELSPPLHDIVINHCSASGFVPKIALYAKQMQTVIGLVSSGCGFALVPSSMRNLQRSGVRYLSLKNASPMINIGLIYKRDCTNPAVKKFVQTIKENVAIVAYMNVEVPSDASIGDRPVKCG